MQCQLIILCSIMTAVRCISFFSWVWNGSPPENSVSDVDTLSLISVPYETPVEHESFIQEASKLTDIQLSSPLEICQHKIILQLKGSCSSVTEEELGKLSVGLLNCQSAVEGRHIHPCTENMSLKQCTINMDSDMWNAYHLMSNRARALCFSIRNVQFRALSELTVNKLVQSTRSQIDSLKTMKESHDSLKDTTAKVLSMIEKKNHLVMEEHQYLKNAQLTVNRHIQDNLRNLYHEKSLVRDSHIQLTTMLGDIEEKIGKTDQHFTRQFSKIKKIHEELLESLTVLQQQNLKSLEKINSTIYSIENISNTIFQEIKGIMDRLNFYVGHSGDQLEKYVFITFHFCYLIGAMIFAAFLNVGFFVRLLIITLIPLNMMIFLKNGIEAGMDFTSITLLIFVLTMVYYAVSCGYHFIIFVIKKVTSKKSASQNAQMIHVSRFEKMKYVLLLVTSLKIVVCYINSLIVRLVSPSKNAKNLISTKKYHDYTNEHPSLISEDGDKDKSIHLESTVEEDEYFEHVGCRLRQKTPNNICSLPESKPSKSRTSAKLCLAKTEFGVECQFYVRPGQRYCDRHK